MEESRKQITFDLDTKALEIYYPKEDWRNAYKDIKKYMLANGFEWQQGSVYVSKKAILSVDVSLILEELVQNNSWLNKCMRDCRQSSIIKEYNQNYLFDKKFDLQPRRELKKKKTLDEAIAEAKSQRTEKNEKPKLKNLEREI